MCMVNDEISIEVIQMSLHEEMRLFTELSGEDGAHTSIARIGGYLDGYERGKADSKWILCDERMPEEETYVLICNDKGDIEISRGSWSTEIHDTWIWYTSGWRFGEAIAWMPLPEPWKG